MRTVCEFNMCTNCKACVSVCKKKAIAVIDDIKACNAVIDETKCINCCVCEKVCSVKNPLKKLAPSLWKQGWTRDEKIRKNSSSGGFATAIEKAFIENGGVVCSCVFDNGDLVFDFALEADDVHKFSGSKYVKSNPKEIYAHVNKYLKNGLKVLFIGLPCQCAAIKKYTNSHEMLYTADLICHGTPSIKILHMFLEEKGYSPQELTSLKFREKTELYISNEKRSIEPQTVKDRYTMAFLKSLCYTENCYFCQYASIERVSDLTLGDSWGSKLDEEEQLRGISLALVQTTKGKELLYMSDLKLEDVDLEEAIKNNNQLREPSKKPAQYNLFYSTLSRTKNFSKSVRKSYFKECIRQDIKAFLIKHKFIRR